ncbi:MAG TPA: hypothetical protein DCL86_09095, partial [Bacteroidales bacterium]|nr:hypothetical protein [Bacteroidales bacterium]
PIPNREVKPVSADDTAFAGGKVGRRHLSNTKATPKKVAFCGFIQSGEASFRIIISFQPVFLDIKLSKLN